MSEKQPTEFERFIRDVIKPNVWESARDGVWVDMIHGMNKTAYYQFNETSGQICQNVNYTKPGRRGR